MCACAWIKTRLLWSKWNGLGSCAITLLTWCEPSIVFQSVFVPCIIYRGHFLYPTRNRFTFSSLPPSTIFGPRIHIFVDFELKALSSWSKWIAVTLIYTLSFQIGSTVFSFAGADKKTALLLFRRGESRQFCGVPDVYKCSAIKLVQNL